uniref:SB domain-containing protein n=3 Tax=Aegilops tauschii subsp. strangulata TaxID=200361 RepID=A0A453LLB9_AEGTS
SDGAVAVPAAAGERSAVRAPVPQHRPLPARSLGAPLRGGRQVAHPQPPRRPRRRLPLAPPQGGPLHPQRRPRRAPAPGRRHRPHPPRRGNLQPARRHLAARDLPALPAPRLPLPHPRHAHQAPHHPLVDRSGLVANAPYLRSWVFPSSNLLDLVRSLSHLFGLDPPLFTRSVAAPSPTPPPAHPAPPPAAASPAMRPEAVYAPVPRPYRFPASPQLAARQPPTEDPAEVFKRNAISKLVDTAYADAAALRTAREAEVDSLFAVQAELRGRGEAVNDGVRRITEEKETLERRLQDVVMATDVIEAWVAENRKGAADDATEAEGAIQPADVLSRQMLECTATDLALEDTIYALDKAVQEGSVPFDGYLRSVRALAREQFFQRVLCTKVNNAQQQAQVARMAARAPQYAS